MCMHCHGAVGHDQEESGGACRAFLVLKHCLHPCALSSMLLSIPGHHTCLQAAAFMHVTPTCTSCSSLRICSCKEGGMMVRRPYIRQPCLTESTSLRKKNGLSSGVVQKWTDQPFWVIARASAGAGFLAVWCAISKTETGCSCIIALLTPWRFCPWHWPPSCTTEVVWTRHQSWWLQQKAWIQFRTGTMREVGTKGEDEQLPKQVWQSLAQRSLARVCDQFEVWTCAQTGTCTCSTSSSLFEELFFSDEFKDLEAYAMGLSSPLGKY